MSPEAVRLAAQARAAVVGAALGVLVFAAGSLLLYDAPGVLGAAGGLAATLAVSLAAGLWAGAPAARAGASPAARWIGAGLAFGLAGVFATAWEIMGWEGATVRSLALLLLAGVPAYAAGLLFPSLSVALAWADDDGMDDDRDDALPRLPAAGVAVCAVAGLAAGSALAGLLLLPRGQPGTLLLATAAALTFPLLLPGPPAVRDEGPEAEEEELYVEETPYGTLRVVDVVHPGGRPAERRLLQDDEIESGQLVGDGRPTFAYVAAAERWLAASTPPGASYLFLGGGAHTLPRRVAERDPDAEVVVVERDPAVTEAARRFFGLAPELGVRTVHGDARSVAEGLEPASFDRVFLDVYDGTERIPLPLTTTEAFAALRRLLRPGGVAALNVIGTVGGEGAVRFWSTVRTFAEVFPSAALYVHLGRDFPERQNALLVGSAAPGVGFPDSAGGFERWPAAEWPDPPGTAVLHDRPAGRTEGAAAS